MPVSENAPRAIRGGLTGIYQLFITLGIMLAFWINYGSLLHITGDAMYIVPLVMQGLPALLLLASQSFCNESPRWLCRKDRWEDATRVLSLVRGLPATHPYVAGELQEIHEQLEHERRLVGGATFKTLMREMWKIPGNRKRALLSVGLMICQQMTGTNAMWVYWNTFMQPYSKCLADSSAETIVCQQTCYSSPGKHIFLLKLTSYRCAANLRKFGSYWKRAQLICHWRLRNHQGRELLLLPCVCSRLVRKTTIVTLDQHRHGLRYALRW